MKIAPLITATFVLCITLPGDILAKDIPSVGAENTETLHRHTRAARVYSGQQTIKVGKKAYKCGFRISYTVVPELRCGMTVARCNSKTRRSLEFSITTDNAVLEVTVRKNKITSCSIGSTFRKDWRMNGTRINTHRPPHKKNHKKCWAKCKSSKHCKFIAWKKKGKSGLCMLFSSHQGGKAKSGFISGPFTIIPTPTPIPTSTPTPSPPTKPTPIGQYGAEVTTNICPTCLTPTSIICPECPTSAAEICPTCPTCKICPTGSTSGPRVTVAPTITTGYEGARTSQPERQVPRCVITQHNVNASKNMPNVNYFLRGYNIMRGNPHQVSVSSVDPGFQEPIFNLCYDDRGETPDGLYLQPDGTLITMCQSCSLSAVTKKISGMKSYRDTLSEKVKISGNYGSWPWWNYRFSVSPDYKKVQSGIHQYSYLYTHSDVSCCAYQIQTDSYKQLPFSQDFLDGVLTLPESITSEEDKTKYRRFIEAFGTHYVIQANMGSLFGQQSKISKESWKKMLDERIDIEWSASLSAIFAFGGYSKTVTIDQEQHKHTASKFNNFSSSQSLYTKGSNPPIEDGIDAKNALKEWIKEAKKYPAPISLEFDSILNLLTNLVSEDVYNNTKQALFNYCGDRSCDQIEDAPWMPWLTPFGGQRSEPKTCDDGNHVTWIQMARGLEPHPWWWDYGLYDICFNCSTETTARCFKSSPPPFLNWWGNKMVCPDKGFEKMRTFETKWEPHHTDNIQAQCNDDTLPQDAFNFWYPESHFPWVSCDDGQQIVGFQVYKNADDRITNFRFQCK